MQIFKFMQKGRRYFARDSTIFCQSFVTKTSVKIEEESMISISILSLTKNYPVDGIVNSSSLLIMTQNYYKIKPSPFVQIVERY